MKINLKTPFELPVENNRIWDFYKDGVTQSFISKYLTCKQQCFLEYVEGWTPIKEDTNLLFGNLLHAAIACSLKLKKDVTESFLIGDPLQEQLANEPALKDLFYCQVEVLLGYYWMVYGEDLFQEWPQIESSFEIYSRFSDIFELPVKLRGVIDGAYINSKDQYWLMDHKGLSVITLDNLYAVLPYDLQINFYLHCEYLAGRKPVGLIYNIIRKPGIRQEPISTYKQRLQDAIAKDMPHYYKRLHIQRTESEVFSWADNFLRPLLKEIQQWYDNDCQPRFHNPDALLGKYFKLCKTFPIITKGDYSNFFQRETPFREILE